MNQRNVNLARGKSDFFSVLIHLKIYFDILLTVHLSITLANDQLDVQFFYIIIRLLQLSTCFEQRRAHHQEVKFY